MCVCVCVCVCVADLGHNADLTQRFVLRNLIIQQASNLMAIHDNTIYTVGRLA